MGAGGGVVLSFQPERWDTEGPAQLIGGLQRSAALAEGELRSGR
jgi:hypothetical protein